MAKRLGPGQPWSGAGGGFSQSGSFGGFGMSSFGGPAAQQTGSGGLSSMIEPLCKRIAEQARERISESLSERLESVISDHIERVLSERLGSAVRTAFVEQLAIGGGFSTDQIAATVCDRIADSLRNEITYRLYETLGDDLREHLTDAVRGALTRSSAQYMQGPMGAEMGTSTPTMGLH
jgi:hypothetical protein